MARSQQRKTGQDRLLALPSGSIRLDSLSSRIARETGFVLSFNAGKINPGAEITFSSTKVNLNDILSYLRKHYRFAYKTIGNHIILYKDTSSDKKVRVAAKVHKDPSSGKTPGVPDKRHASGMLVEKEMEPLHLTVLPNVGTGISFRNSSSFSPKEIRKVLIRQNVIPQINAAGSVSHSEGKFTPLSVKSGHAEKQKGTDRIRFGKEKDRFYAAAGLTASEVLYVNPQIKIGLPWLFAIASWRTNFKASGIFYGLGTSVQLSDHWGLQLSVSSGVLSKKFKFLTSTDTIMRIKTRLTRINLLVGKHLSNRLTLQFGPVLNFMKSHYSLKDSSMAGSLPIGADLSKEHYILHPPYMLSENFDKQTDSGKKIWIGLQISLFYRIW